MPLMETAVDHVKGEDFITVTAAEKWSINLVKRLHTKHPDKVEIRHVNPDGSLVARLPFSWLAIRPKRVLSESQLNALRAYRTNNLCKSRGKQSKTARTGQG